MKNFIKFSFLLLTISIVSYSQIVTVNGIRIPDGGDANSHINGELLIGGPSSDILNITFPLAAATNCLPAETPRTLNQEIDTYGKVVLVVTSPSNCPYCVIAANAAKNDIISRLPNIRLWHVVARLEGQTSDCDEVGSQKNLTQSSFLNQANFTFMESYWWDGALGRPHHNDKNTAFWMGPGMPSSYRIFDPQTKKLTSYGYYLDVAALDAAIARNFIPGGSLTLAPMSLSFPASASGLNFSITGSGGWVTADNAAWLTLSTASGSGNRTLTANATANLSTNARTATISVTGGSITRTITVSQAGAAPIFNVNPVQLVYGSASSSNNISITSNMNWNTSGTPSWITLSSASGTTNLVISSTASANASITLRTGSITFSSGSNNIIVNITQTGAAPQLTINPNALNPAQAGSLNPVTVTSNMSWTVSENATWLSTNITSGNGNSVFTVTSSPNTTIFSRSAGVTISGSTLSRILTVTQPGITPSLVVNPTIYGFGSAAGSKNLTITSNLPTWTVNETVAWLTLGSNSGSGNANVNVSADENTSIISRSTIITVSGASLTQFITITQTGANESMVLNPTSLSYNSSGGIRGVTVTSNVNWIVSSNVAWVTLSTTSGTAGLRSFNITASSNINITPRAGEITISGGSLKQVISLTQNGASAVLTVNPASISYGEAGSSQNINILTNTNWVLSSSGLWLSSSALSGSGNATPSITATTNTSTSSRNAIISVSVLGSIQSVLVSQAGATPVLSTDISSFSKTSAGGSQNIIISSNTSYTASSNQTWLTLSTNSGFGNMTLTANTSANTSILNKTAQITLNFGSGNSKVVNVTILGANPSLGVSTNNLTYNNLNSSKSLSITSNTNWSISNNQSWITLSSNSGSMNQTIDIEVSKNTITTARIASITVTAASLIQIVNITQAGANFELTVSSNNFQMNASSGVANVDILSNTNWNVSNPVTWISLNNTSGNNNATIEISTSSNNYYLSRSAIITVSGGGFNREITVNQLGESPSLSVSNNSLTFVANPSATQSVNISSNLDWTVSNPHSWINISTNTGILNGLLTFSVAENLITSDRTATITVSGSTINRVIEINQNAAATIFNLSSSNMSVNSFAGTATFTITSNITWSASVLPNWITLSTTSGNSNQNIEFSFIENPSSRFRSAVVTIIGGSQTLFFEINQNGGIPTWSIDKSIVTTTSALSEFDINVTSNSSWTVFEDLTWVSIMNATGIDDGQFKIRTISNPTTQSRMGTVTVSGLGIKKVIDIFQEGATQSLNLDMTVLTLSSDINSGILNITSNTFWTITGLPNWLEADPISGEGDMTIILNPSLNSGAERMATLTITGQKGFQEIIVSQKASPTTNLSSLSPENTIISMYPNPISLGGTVEIISDYKSEVYNLLGTKLNVPILNNKIETTNLHKGIFFIKFENGITKKLVIE
ncbi:MAG: hypothetical protein EAZ27_04585 [Cytophagales bacterium]|nr:MAG: hypothetical protein EAZ27_04585 [Cytophagales bacterium]